MDFKQSRRAFWGVFAFRFDCHTSYAGDTAPGETSEENSQRKRVKVKFCFIDHKN
jgi:hypothetical protein